MRIIGSKYYDPTAAIQVIGCIANNPALVYDDDTFFFDEEDFSNDFHKVVFGSVYNLIQMGTTKINPKVVEDYLQKRPESLGIYKASKGSEWLLEAITQAEPQSFYYNYDRLKKMTLLRGYDNFGLNMDWLYDPDNIMDLKKKKRQEDYLDSLTLVEIANLIEDKMTDIRSRYIDGASDEAINVGDGIFQTLEDLAVTPELGAPLYGPFINMVTRGCRIGKFYLRSAATGVGKSRSMIADACNLSCSEIYDLDLERWVPLNSNQNVLFISTELELTEVQTMCLAFLSGVNEEHILTNRYAFDEKERVFKAAQILSESNLYIEITPDFSLRDIENCIKRNIRINKVHYVIFDYIHTSMKILEEITRRSGGVKLREDNILFLLSVKLKDICNEFGIFILSGTQLNADWKTSETPDQNLLRGAKSIADKIDCGMIMLDVTKEDDEVIQSILADRPYLTKPNVKMSIYKNRRGSFNRCFLWMKADKGICRFETMFITDYKGEMITDSDRDYNIKVQ